MNLKTGRMQQTAIQKINNQVKTNVKMEIIINDHRKIKAIQEEFSTMFPYLKIEFFAKPHTKGGGSSKKLMKSNSKTLGQCRVIHTKGHISIVPTMSVGDLEEMFRDRYGLSAQVFRKSGRSWLETTATDNWSLEKQNAEGESISKFNIKYEKEMNDEE